MFNLIKNVCLILGLLMLVAFVIFLFLAIKSSPKFIEPRFKMNQAITYDVPYFLSDVCDGKGIVRDMECEKGKVDFKGCSFVEGQAINYQVETNPGCPNLVIVETSIHEIK